MVIVYKERKNPEEQKLFIGVKELPAYVYSMLLTRSEDCYVFDKLWFDPTVRLTEESIERLGYMDGHNRTQIYYGLFQISNIDKVIELEENDKRFWWGNRLTTCVKVALDENVMTITDEGILRFNNDPTALLVTSARTV